MSPVSTQLLDIDINPELQPRIGGLDDDHIRALWLSAPFLAADSRNPSGRRDRSN